MLNLIYQKIQVMELELDQGVNNQMQLVCYLVMILLIRIWMIQMMKVEMMGKEGMMKVKLTLFSAYTTRYVILQIFCFCLPPLQVVMI